MKSNLNKSISIGEAAHITAAAKGGARFDPALNQKQRESIENGIWLCRRCHKIVDRDFQPYSTAELRMWKEEAEAHADECIQQGLKAIGSPSLVIITHKSMENFPISTLGDSVHSLLDDDTVLEVVLDQTDLFKNKQLTNKLEAVGRQIGIRGEVNALIDKYEPSDFIYHGIAHIPLVFHLGFLFGRGIGPHYYEKNRTNSQWRHIVHESAQEFDTTVSRPSSDWSTCTDAVVRISTSYAVTDEQTNPVVETAASFEITANIIGLDTITSRAQIERVCKEFNMLLDEIASSQSIENIHIFASVPVPLAFALGQQIRPTIHPNVIVYNYRRQDSPAYKWGILMTDDTENPKLVIQN